MAKNFETSLNSLTALVEDREKGGASREDLLKQFEKGIKLVNDCQTSLKKAEQKIETYNKEKDTLSDFIPSDDEEH